MQEQLDHRKVIYRETPFPKVDYQSPPEPRPPTVSSRAYGGASCGAAGEGEDPPRGNTSLLQQAINQMALEVGAALMTANAVVQAIKERMK